MYECKKEKKEYNSGLDVYRFEVGEGSQSFKTKEMSSKIAVSSAWRKIAEPIPQEDRKQSDRVQERKNTTVLGKRNTSSTAQW